MSEKRFKLSKYVTPSSVSNFCDENGRMLNKEVVKVLNEQQEQLDLYKEAILTMLGLLADKGIIFSGVKDEWKKVYYSRD